MRFLFPAGGRSPIVPFVMTIVLAMAATAPVVAQDWRPRSKSPPVALDRHPADAIAAFQRYRDAWRSAVPRPGRGLPTLYATIGETEPNDTTTTATPVSLNDTVTGVIDPAGDVDFYALDLTAGVELDLDVDAAQFGSALDPVIGLFDVDSVTLLAVNDDFDGLDSRIIYSIPADGRYFVAIVAYGGDGGPQHTYTFRFQEFVTDEVEPNDTPAQATATALLDTVAATLGGSGDVDFYAVSFPAPVRLQVRVGAVGFAARLHLWDGAGTTLLDSVSAFFAQPVELRSYIETAGQYYVSVQQEPGTGDGGFYSVTFDTTAVGPGDPTTTFAIGLNGILDIAAGREGETYVITDWGATVRRVDPNGSASVVADDIFPNGIVVDGFGNLLISGWDGNSRLQRIWRVTDAGVRTVFADSNPTTGPMTIGPDGDVWAVICGVLCPAIIRFDPLGNPKDTVGIGTSPLPSHLAFSPSGQLHFASADDRVYRLNANGSVTAAVIADRSLEGLAFDEDGRLYVANGYLGTITLYGTDYQPVDAPFAATRLGGPIDLAFLRDGSGRMTSRLLASNGGYNLGPPYNGAIMEVNPSGVMAPGLQVGVDLLTVLPATLPNGVVGEDYDATLEHNGSSDGSWRVTGGTLPTGLALDASSGTISGVPTEAGMWSFTARVDAGNRLGVRTFSVTITEPTLSVTAAVDLLLGVANTITPEQERYLDIQGNNNGQFDIGDLRAYLRAQGQLPALTRVGGPVPEKGGDR